MVFEALASLEHDANRRSPRIVTMLPVLKVDGVQVTMLDFSETGFRARLNGSYRRPGATGEADIFIEAAGYTVHKRVRFETVHLLENALGARYEVLDTKVEESFQLF